MKCFSYLKIAITNSKVARKLLEKCTTTATNMEARKVNLQVQEYTLRNLKIFKIFTKIA